MQQQDIMTEVLEIVTTLAEHMDERFDCVEKRLNRVEATMVTKDYLDDKLADLRGDIIVLMRKQDQKVVALVELLITKNIIHRDDAEGILAMQPFPQH